MHRKKVDIGECFFDECNDFLILIYEKLLTDYFKVFITIDGETTKDVRSLGVILYLINDDYTEFVGKFDNLTLKDPADFLLFKHKVLKEFKSEK